jgi:hypothetical protein
MSTERGDARSPRSGGRERTPARPSAAAERHARIGLNREDARRIQGVGRERPPKLAPVPSRSVRDLFITRGSVRDFMGRSADARNRPTGFRALWWRFCGIRWTGLSVDMAAATHFRCARTCDDPQQEGFLMAK